MMQFLVVTILMLNNYHSLVLRDEIDQRPYTCCLANMATKLTNNIRAISQRKKLDTI